MQQDKHFLRPPCTSSSQPSLYLPWLDARSDPKPPLSLFSGVWNETIKIFQMKIWIKSLFSAGELTCTGTCWNEILFLILKVECWCKLFVVSAASHPRLPLQDKTWLQLKIFAASTHVKRRDVSCVLWAIPISLLLEERTMSMRSRACSGWLISS